MSGMFCAVVPLVILCAVLSLPGHCQLNQGGVPLSIQYGLNRDGVTDLVVPPPDTLALAREDALSPVPMRFAVNLPVDVMIAVPEGIAGSPVSGIRNPAHGTWYPLPDGSGIWLCTISVPGARALTLYFDRFRLPPGGRLFVYNKDRSKILGAFTNRNNSPQGVFATALIPGDLITLEYNQPATVSEHPGLHLSEIAYAYRGIRNSNSGLGFGDSGPCEVNINCPEGTGWQDQKKGVMRIAAKKTGGTYWCSGSLVNNARQDCTPYVLTADHCGQDATPQHIGEWIFYFGYEAPGCPDPPVEPGFRAMSGATLIASSGDVNIKGSDFFLVLLKDAIPDTFDVWFNGWNRQGTPAQSGTGIHHPWGDIRTISTFTTPAVSAKWNGHTDFAHWEVKWAATPSGHGVTEGGSSGSPLFDAAGRIVGALTGGDSSCDTSALGKPDYYGKFSYSWDKNGSDSARRLDCWLDPDNTGVEILDGIPLIIPSATGLTGFQICPNPSSGILLLRSSLFMQSGLWQVTILDARGITLLSESVQSGLSPALRMDISRLPAGFYLVQVRSESRSLTGRVIKL